MGKIKYFISEYSICNIIVFWLEEISPSIMAIKLLDNKDIISFSEWNILLDPGIRKFYENKNFSSYERVDDAKLPKNIIRLMREIDSYFNLHAPISYPIDELCLEFLTDFQRDILRTLYDIPYGEILSYKQLGAKAGYTNASRAVGNVMNKNPFPLIIPCHRVIKNDGSIGGFALGREIKQRLLNHEGLKL